MKEWMLTKLSVDRKRIQLIDFSFLTVYKGIIYEVLLKNAQSGAKQEKF